MGWYGLSTETRSRSSIASWASVTSARSTSVFGSASVLLDGGSTVEVADDMASSEERRMGLLQGLEWSGSERKEGKARRTQTSRVKKP